MIEQSHRSLLPPSPGDLDTLQRRANQQRQRYKQSPHTLTARWQQARTALGSPPRSISRLPARFLLHAVVALVLPMAVALSQLPPGVLRPAAPSAAPQNDAADMIMPIAPLSLDGQGVVGDAPLEDNGDIPVPLSLISRSEALAPVIVPATVAGERVLLRGGPGVEYDAVGRISGDTPLQVIGRYGDWFKVRERAGKPEYWIAGELLNIPETAVYTLFEVQASAIPAPPPPKIALVRETGLALRDGPGTNYVSMTTFQAGTQLDLLERYQDWFHVGVPGGSDGWVKGEFLDMTPGMVERLLVAETIPDPNPAMIGSIADNSVNLRKGPDSKYAKVGVVNAGLQVDIVGKYKDWFKIKLPEGNLAWVFSDLLNASAPVVRRVPVTKDFPALPVKPAARPTARGGGAGGGAGANLASIPASGDVASYAVQFNGSRYVYGGASPRGFDCSGLTSYIYKQFGVNLPHNAAAQFSTKYGASVGSMDNLAPGDLVFFVRTTSKAGITHVGLYIGGGRMLNAMTPRYGVQISNLNEQYWVQRYYGAIRVSR